MFGRLMSERLMFERLRRRLRLRVLSPVDSYWACVDDYTPAMLRLNAILSDANSSAFSLA